MHTPHVRRRHSWRIVAAATAAAALLPAIAASAHPGLRPGEVAADATNEVELVIPHGCGAEGGMPEEGIESSPTTLVAVEWPEQVEFMAIEATGWVASMDDGVTTWTDAGGATTDPILLPVDVVVGPEVAAGDVYASVYQECANGESFRWQALPDEGGSPALRLAVQPAGTAPARRGAETDDATSAATESEHGGHDEMASDDEAGHATDDHDMEEMTNAATMDMATESTTSSSPIVAAAAAGAGDESSSPMATGALVVLGIMVAGGAALLVRRRMRSAAG